MARLLKELIPKPESFSLTINPIFRFDRPAQAAMICSIIALSGEIEQIKTDIAIRLLRGEAAAISAMLASLRSARHAAIGSIVETKLPKQPAKLYGKIVKLAENFETHRNRFAHWRWAVCAELPECICLVDPKVSAANNARRLSNHHELLAATIEKQDPWTAINLANEEEVRNSTIVFHPDDLVDLNWEGTRSLGFFMRFLFVIYDDDQGQRQREFLQLEALLHKPELPDPTGGPRGVPKPQLPSESSDG